MVENKLSSVVRSVRPVEKNVVGLGDAISIATALFFLNTSLIASSHTHPKAANVPQYPFKKVQEHFWGNVVIQYKLFRKRLSKLNAPQVSSSSFQNKSAFFM